MQQLRCYGDDRNKGFCVHCGGPNETVDHVPSKVLLDEPYPANLMAASVCRQCNNDFSGSSGFSYGSFPMMNSLNASAGAGFGPDSSHRQFCAIADSRHFRSQIDIRSGQNRSLVCNKRLPRKPSIQLLTRVSPWPKSIVRWALAMSIGTRGSDGSAPNSSQETSRTAGAPVGGGKTVELPTCLP
jgi:hypothetical protein